MTTLHAEGLSMHAKTTGPTDTRHATDRIAQGIAMIAILAAVFALVVPVSFSGPQSIAATAPARAQATAVPNDKLPDGERVPLFFGFLEFDWDPDAPGGVPGFDPWPKHDPRGAETSRPR